MSSCRLSFKWCFINKFREEHVQIINTANSSSVITPPIQSAGERISINNQSSLAFIISRLLQSLLHPDFSPSARFYPSTGRSTRGEHSGSGLNAELGPLSPVGGSTPGSGIITELGALSSDSTPNMHNPLLSLLYVSVNSWKWNKRHSCTWTTWPPRLVLLWQIPLYLQIYHIYWSGDVFPLSITLLFRKKQNKKTRQNARQRRPHRWARLHRGQVHFIFPRLHSESKQAEVAIYR